MWHRGPGSFLTGARGRECGQTHTAVFVGHDSKRGLVQGEQTRQLKYGACVGQGGGLAGRMGAQLFACWVRGAGGALMRQLAVWAQDDR